MPFVESSPTAGSWSVKASPKAKHDEMIKQISQKTGNVPLKWSFFISHAQAKHSDVAALLALKLETATGVQCWFDQTAKQVTHEGMVQGIQGSAIFLLLLSRGIFTREFVVFEVRTALMLKKKIMVLFETDSRFDGYAPFADYFEDAPDDIRHIMVSAEAIPYRRKSYEQNAMIDEILRQCESMLEPLTSSKSRIQPLQVLGSEEACLRIRQAGRTACCFIDLGTLSTAVYVYALASDGSLDSSELFRLPDSLFMLWQSGDNDLTRKQIADALKVALPVELEMLGHDISRLYAVKVGATFGYDVTPLAKKEYEERASGFEVWLKDIVCEALGPDMHFQFDYFKRAHEARLQLCAIQTAMQFVFPEMVYDATLCAGGSSLQVLGGPNDYHSIDCGLKDGAKHVAAEGWEAYKKSILPQFKCLDSIRQRLSSKVRRTEDGFDRPLRLVLTSSFYFAALACGIVQEGGDPSFVPFSLFTSKARKLLEDAAAETRDKANVVRLLCCLETITSSSSKHLEILAVRDWKIQGKPYRATWSTGAFIEDMRFSHIWSFNQMNRRSTSKFGSQSSGQNSEAITLPNTVNRIINA